MQNVCTSIVHRFGVKNQSATMDSVFSYRETIRRKEGIFLFNDALNTFIYGYMVSDIW